jgi:hypothetical protein
MTQLIKKISLFLSLFLSTSTLLCCALPALFVGLGAGAVFAGLTSAVPQLIWVSEHKVSVFIIAGLLLLISRYLELKNKDKPCDISQREICEQTRNWSLYIWSLSLIFYGVGLFFAFVLPFFFSG